jgi:hypothetical protein
MTSSPYASEAKIDEALTAIGAELIGQTEQQLLQQLVVAAAVGTGSTINTSTKFDGGIGGNSYTVDEVVKALKDLSLLV